MNISRAFQIARTSLLLGMCMAAVGFVAIGCQNTAEGVKDDTAKNGAAVGNAADKAGDAVKTGADKTVDAAKNAGEALGVTPKVKSAIIADAKLNDTKNLVNVDTKDGMVYLKGHVLNNEQKKLAGEIAAKTVKENGSNEKIMNQLTVESH